MLIDRPINVVDFVDAWMKAYDCGGTLSDVAQSLGIKIEAVVKRANNLYYSQGLELPALIPSKT
jgi:hypothetical protein